MKGAVLLYRKMRADIAQLWFGVIHGLAVGIFLGTSYTDRCIWAILPIERGIILVQFKRIAVFSVIKESEKA